MGGVEGGRPVLRAPARSTVAGSGADPIAREEELDTLSRLAGPDGGAVVVRGAAGVGKTTLLGMVAARRDAETVWVRGTEAEAVLPYAGAADLLLGFREHFDGLPAVQRDALEAGLALASGSAPSPLATCAAALAVLGAVAESRPLLVLVDDFQWVDPPSRQLLLFVARRLAADAVTMVLAVRDQPGAETDTADLPTMRLAGFEPADCRRLAASLDVDVPAELLENLIDQTGGNPLALVETLRSARDGQAGAGPGQVVTPAVGSSLDRFWRATVASLPAPTQRALLVVAAMQQPALVDVARALAALGGSLEDLAPAEAEGLVAADRAGVALRHPLLRPVVLSCLPVATRQSVYAALAEGATGAEHAWYRAAAATGPDDEVAALLADAARDARERSGHGAAARIWRKAADLTPRADQRVAHLLDAATDALYSGECALARAWANLVVDATDEPTIRADAALVRARADLWLAQPDRAIDDLVQAADAVLAHDRDRAATLYAEAAIPATMANRGPEAVRFARRSGRLRHSILAELYLAMSLSHFGDLDEARGALDRAHALGLDDDRSVSPQARLWATQIHSYVEDFTTLKARLDPEVDRARNGGAPVLLCAALGFRCEHGWWTGSWSAAYADGSEGAAWSDELQQVHGTSYVEAWLARIDAARGDRDRFRERIDRAQRKVEGLQIGCIDVYIPATLGFAALTAGDLEEAADHLDRAWNAGLSGGLGNPNVVPVVGDLLEALVRTRENDRADAVVDWLDGAVARTGLVYPTAVRARCEGLRSATVEEATRHFDTARAAHARVDMPFERARTRLCEGETMRRLRRPATARPALREALAVFRGLGARPWAERAANELAATGERPSAPCAEHRDVLSPQEFQIARLVAEGRSNVEAADALFLSRKTVEAHLTRAYRKLGVRSRTELVRAFVPGDERSRPPRP